MGRWRKTIKIKDALGGCHSAEAIKSAADTIIGRLKETGAPCSRLEKARDMADQDSATALLIFDDALSRIYDWADAERIWLS